MVTRRPLELRLVHLDDPSKPINISSLIRQAAKPYGIFEKEDREKKYFTFQEIHNMIENVTEKVCGKNKAIVDIPIVLVIYSPHCPDLTIIDLPGITRISIED